MSVASDGEVGFRLDAVVVSSYLACSSIIDYKSINLVINSWIEAMATIFIGYLGFVQRQCICVRIVAASATFVQGTAQVTVVLAVHLHTVHPNIVGNARNDTQTTLVWSLAVDVAE